VKIRLSPGMDLHVSIMDQQSLRCCHAS
jgi:hypothetical protein